MADYKLYFLGRSGRIEQRLDLECEDDAKAIANAERRSDGRHMELWRGERLVKRFERTEPRP